MLPEKIARVIYEAERGYNEPKDVKMPPWSELREEIRETYVREVHWIKDDRTLTADDLLKRWSDGNDPRLGGFGYIFVALVRELAV